MDAIKVGGYIDNFVRKKWGKLYLKEIVNQIVLFKLKRAKMSVSTIEFVFEL